MSARAPQHAEIDFERRDLSIRNTLIIGACVLLGMWIVTCLLYFLFSGLAHHREHVSSPVLPIEEHGYVQPPAPRLQQSPPLDMKRMNQYEDWELSHYHWVDSQHRFVTIPIERAIDIVASRGIPAAIGAANPTNTPPQEGTRETGFRGKVEPEAR